MVSRILVSALLFAGFGFAQFEPPTVKLPVSAANGGTGASSLAAAGIVQGQGTSEIDCIAYSNLNGCFDAAKAFVTTNETGSGKAIRIMLPQGISTLTGTYTWVSGMQLYGVLPRVEYNAGQSPDDQMFMNGGSWIDCGGVQCFTGSGLRGVVMQNVGMFDFTTAAAIFGGNNVDGIAQSQIRNIWLQGSQTNNVSQSGLVIYNMAHLTIDHLKANNMNSCLTMIGQQNTWFPGDSNILDTYCSTYPKSAALGNNTTAGITLETLAPSSGSTLQLQYLNFYGKTQVVAQPGGDGTGYDILLNNVLSNAMEYIEVATSNSSMQYGINITNSSDQNFFGITSPGVFMRAGLLGRVQLPHLSPAPPPGTNR